MTDLRTIIAAHGLEHNQLATRYSRGEFTDDDSWIAAIKEVDDATERAIHRLIDEARLEEHRALSPWVTEPQAIAAIDFRTAIVRRAIDENLHVSCTTDEPVAPEYKDARWGKPK